MSDQVEDKPEVKKEVQFDFVVESLTQTEMEELLDVIIKWVEDHGTYLGGGCYQLKEGDDEQQAA